MGAGAAGELTPTHGERSMAALIQIGEFRPDLPEFGNDGATVALNVVPAATSYRPLASLSPYSDALSARCQGRSEEHTSELQSLMRISYAVFCLKKKKKTN